MDVTNQKTENPPYPNIYLVGFMGAGKTTIAAYLKELTGLETAEMDELIVKKSGMAVTGIFKKHGEEGFRKIETEVLRELAGKKSTIVSCGGGIVLRDENLALMKESGTVVLLTAEAETVYERIKEADDRPLLNDNTGLEGIVKLMGEREGRYLKTADITIKTDGKNPSLICEELLSRLGLYNDNICRVLKVLKENNIRSRLFRHKAVYVMDAVLDLGDNESKDAVICKNLFLCDDKKRNCFLVIVAGDKKTDLKALADNLGVKSLRFASEDRLYKYLKITRGAVSPLAVINDESHAVTVVFDSDLLNCKRVRVHPNDNTATLVMDFADIKALTEKYGNKIVYADMK